MKSRVETTTLPSILSSKSRGQSRRESGKKPKPKQTPPWRVYQRQSYIFFTCSFICIIVLNNFIFLTALHLSLRIGLSVLVPNFPARSCSCLRDNLAYSMARHHITSQRSIVTDRIVKRWEMELLAGDVSDVAQHD
jgi:hypothetical protein